MVCIRGLQAINRPTGLTIRQLAIDCFINRAYLPGMNNNHTGRQGRPKMLDGATNRGINFDKPTLEAVESLAWDERWSFSASARYLIQEGHAAVMARKVEPVSE